MHFSLINAVINETNMFACIPKIEALPDAGADVTCIYDRLGLAKNDGRKEQWPLRIPAAFACAFELKSVGRVKAFPELAYW